MRPTPTSNLFFCVGTFAAPGVLAYTGAKRGMVGSMCCYSLYTAAFLLPRPEIILPASAIGGFAGAVLWTAQGEYFTANALAYAVARGPAAGPPRLSRAASVQGAAKQEAGGEQLQRDRPLRRALRQHLPALPAAGQALRIGAPLPPPRPPRSSSSLSTPGSRSAAPPPWAAYAACPSPKPSSPRPQPPPAATLATDAPLPPPSPPPSPPSPPPSPPSPPPSLPAGNGGAPLYAPVAPATPPAAATEAVDLTGSRCEPPPLTPPPLMGRSSISRPISTPARSISTPRRPGGDRLPARPLLRGGDAVRAQDAPPLADQHRLRCGDGALPLQADPAHQAAARGGRGHVALLALRPRLRPLRRPPPRARAPRPGTGAPSPCCSARVASPWRAASRLRATPSHEAAVHAAAATATTAAASGGAHGCAAAPPAAPSPPAWPSPTEGALLRGGLQGGGERVAGRGSRTPRCARCSPRGWACRAPSWRTASAWPRGRAARWPSWPTSSVRRRGPPSRT